MKSIPHTSDMLEELATKAEVEIDKLAVTSFKTALNELIDFHRFLISAHVTEDVDKKAIFSFAQMGYFRSLHYDWLSQYRRLFDVAVKKIENEQEASKDIILSLMHTTQRLLPEKNSKFASDVTTALLDLHLYLVHKFVDWAMRKSEEFKVSSNKTASLPQGLQKKYEDILRSFIGASENILQIIPSLYGWDTDADPETQAANQWLYFRKSWPMLRQHLRNTTYFLVVSLWNGDRSGSKIFCDALSHWLGPLDYKLTQDYLLHHELLTPDLLDLDWSEVLDRIKPFQRHSFGENHPAPVGLLSAILKNTFKDSVAVLSGLVMRWFVFGEQSSQLLPETVSKLIKESFPQNSTYHYLVSLIRILSSTGFHLDSGYGGHVNEIIRLFDQMSERPVVSGRVFTPSTAFRSEDLVCSWFAVLLGLSTTAGFDSDVKKITSLIAKEEMFPHRDISIRSIEHDLKKMKEAFSGMNESLLGEKIKAIQEAFGSKGAIVGASSKATQALDMLLEAIAGQREALIRSKPIDQERLEIIASASEKTAFTKETGSFPISIFQKTEGTKDKLKEYKFNLNYEKGALTNPLMAQTTVNEEDWLTNTISQHVGALIIYDALNKIEQKKEIMVSSGEDFWNTIKDFSQESTKNFVLLINRAIEPEWLYNWRYPSFAHEENAIPSDLKIWHSEKHKGIAGYDFHINNIQVYQAPIGKNHVYLLPEVFFKKVSFTIFENGKKIMPSFEENENDPWHGKLTLSLARKVEVSNEEVLEIMYSTVSDEEEN